MLVNLLENAATQTPSSTALSGSGLSLDYATLARQASRFADQLIAQGMAAGDRVILHSGNHPNTLIVFWGVLKAGGVACVLHRSIKPPKLAQIAARLSAWATLHDEAIVGLHALGANAPQFGVRPERTDRQASDSALIIFTSGSLGETKGVVMSHAAVLAVCASIQGYLGYQPTDKVTSNLSLSFDCGLYQALLCAQVGAALTLVNEQIGALNYPLEIADASVLPIMPALVAIWQHVPNWQPNFSVRLISSTGAAISIGALDWLKRMFPNAQFYSMFGLTECKRVSYLKPEMLASKPGSVGKAIPGTRLWIADSAGDPVASNVIGELVVSGPHLMSGYWQDALGTAKRSRIDPSAGQRVLFTGDSSYVDADGYLYFVGRSDDSIKSRGVKVSPREVELAILEIPGMLEVAVYGVADELQGQAIAAAVVLMPDISLSKLALRQLCSQCLEHALVRKHLFVLSKMLLSENGKVDKSQLPRC